MHALARFGRWRCGARDGLPRHQVGAPHSMPERSSALFVVRENGGAAVAGARCEVNELSRVDSLKAQSYSGSPSTPMRLHRLLFIALVALAAAQDTPDEDTTAPAEAVADADDAAAEVEEESVEEEVATEALPEPEAEPAAAAPPSGGSNKASMQWVVTAKMKSQLSKLGYSGAEVSGLDPERAAAIIKHSISRPKAGVPASWNKKGSKSGGSRSVLSGLPKIKGVGSAVYGPALLLAGGLGFALSRGGGGASAGVSAAVAAALAEVPEASEPAPLPYNENDLWLDRQIDKLIAVIKALIGR